MVAYGILRWDVEGAAVHAEQQRLVATGIHLCHAAEQRAVVIQVGMGFGDAAPAALEQALGQVAFDLFHGVDAQGVELEPRFAQPRIYLRFDRGALGDAAQADHLGNGIGAEDLLPQGIGRGVGEFAEYVEAALLAFLQVQQSRLQLCLLYTSPSPRD